MATFSYIPSYSSSVDVTPRVLSATFGDGYEQNTADGINSQAEIWNLTFSDRESAEAQAIVDFFKDNNTATVSFDWTTPGGDAYKFLCKSWKRNFESPMTSSISCTFQQVFW